VLLLHCQQTMGWLQ